MTIYPTEFLNEINEQLTASIRDLHDEVATATHDMDLNTHICRPKCRKCKLATAYQRLIDIKVNLECGAG